MTQEELLTIERSLWTDGPEAYRRHLDDQCLVAFTEMAGARSREEVAGMVGDAPRWRDVEIEVEGVARPTDDITILTYRASAARGADERYRALVSSGYVRRGGEWRMMFHHQTPLKDDA